MSVEEKLLKFRKQKSKEYQTHVKTSYRTTQSRGFYIIPPFLTRACGKIDNWLQNNEKIQKISEKCKKIPILNNPRLMKIFVWLLLFGFFCSIEFGVIFILLSGFYAIYINTGTSKRSKDEKSAYSVFNPNCERINGTLTAEQFEKEIRHGSTSVS